jgi:hypothetical protein
MIEAILSILGVVAKPLFDWLNARVDADKQIHIVDAKTMGAIAQCSRRSSRRATRSRVSLSSVIS